MKMVASFFYLLLVFGCSGQETATESERSPDFANLSPDCFVADASSPIIERGDLFAGSTWNDPHVLKAGNTFVMYASSDVNFDGNIKIYRLISTDGKNFSLSPTSPVFEKSSGVTDWDRKSVETPAVVLFKGTYYLFYTGYPVTQTDPTSYQIGYATSSDGISWTRQATRFAPTDPSGGVNMDFNQYIVAEPAPVIFNDQIYLYFTALGADAGVGTTLQTIGLVTSPDGVNWSSPQRVLRPDQSLYPRGSNWKGYSTPHAIFVNNQVQLYFTVVNDSSGDRQVKLHRAVSSDGMSGWIHDSEEIFDRSEFNPWADRDLRSPSLLLSGTTLNFWFAGNGDTSNFPNVDMGIGLARCEL